MAWCQVGITHDDGITTFSGLSTDDKNELGNVINGSIAICNDTGLAYRYDEENMNLATSDHWWLIKTVNINGETLLI